MTSLLARVGRACVAHPWRTITGWVLVLATAFTVAGAVGGVPQDNYDVPGLRAQAGTELLRRVFPDTSGTEARVVLHMPGGQPVAEQLAEDVTGRLREVADVGNVGTPRFSDDRDTALIDVRYTAPVTDLGDDIVQRLRDATSAATAAGVQVEFAGQVGEQEKAGGGAGEAIGLLVALVVLLIAFGSVLAAGLPIVSALFGLGAGTALTLLVAAFTDVSTLAPTVATMVGLGVGIDYALLLVTRYAEDVRGGLPPRVAAVTATGTAGRSVLAAGATVLVSLSGLLVSGLPDFRSIGYATALVVLATMAAALTLVPALCALSGQRIVSRRHRTRTSAAAAMPTGSERWARRVARRPVLWGLGALAVLLALGAPMLGMRTWPDDAGSGSVDTTARRAYDLIAAEYGPGAYAPVVVAVDLSTMDPAELPGLGARIAAEPGVAEVSPPLVSEDLTGAMIVVQTDYAPRDERSAEVVTTLRDVVLPDGAEVTGTTALYIDLAGLLAERLWWAIGMVVTLSVTVLVVVFRSILVPLKAALVNLLSVAAAYGVLTAVFQWGWGAGLIGVDRPVPVSTFVPLVLFTVLFGLSMDYEVFLISRIREHWQESGDPVDSMVRGLAATGRTITSAALIMVAVFGGFVAAGDTVTKMIGLGLATAVAVDATVVRLVLVPAAMVLMGRANWWMPRRLGRLLPGRPRTSAYVPQEEDGTPAPVG
ncbi:MULTISPECIES: MMPL family transporter [Catenuloplanes]|uniref:RND superfamily putative drug exporter n=1 Tax=Catenuloplanes niger TaxID=587534 RepID=A0AAE3ZL42_9ACTN|nr:MMPL family transporter [Catenuloplanes niger]MDR7320676.1 RND superfamily putative drug exporter [Catenuloplanes niger]